jgi:hypothetical protein
VCGCVSDGGGHFSTVTTIPALPKAYSLAFVSSEYLLIGAAGGVYAVDLCTGLLHCILQMPEGQPCRHVNVAVDRASRTAFVIAGYHVFYAVDISSLLLGA